MHDRDNLAQKQSELSKALSAAYLNHQIAELESQVRQLPISQEVQRPNGVKQVASGNAPVIGQASGDGGVKAVLNRIDDESPGLDVARIDDDDRSVRDLDGDDDRRDEEGDEWRVAVVDVSGLMWAPKAARGLVQRGFEVVVPADGIRTLDLLKKGNSPSAIAARSAARYIEHASRHHQLLSADPSLTVQLGTDYKRGRGLRIQRDDEYRKADELSSLPLMPGEEGPPKWVKSVLGCAAYFAGINKAEVETSFSRDRDELEPQPVLYVANPPLAVELAQATNGIGPETKEMRDQAESNGNFLERGEGVVVLQEAERFELGLEVLRDEEDETFDMRRTGGKARGKGRDVKARPPGPSADRSRVRGGKSKKEEEKQPEVKILLRRQPVAEHPDSAGQSQAQVDRARQSENDGSPFSDQSPLPDASALPAASMLFANHDGFTGGAAGSNLSPLVKSDSIGSHVSADISPRRGPFKPLPGGSKSPASKFVPLSRETHPVRRRAGSTSSDESDLSRPGQGASRGTRGGGGRGGGHGRGGGGRGAGAGAGAGARSKRGGKDKDNEFKNGNFTLLQRPAPPPPPRAASASSVPAESIPVPSAPKAPNARPPVRPNGPAVRGILARPTRGHAAAHARPPPHPSSGPGGPPPFVPDIRGRGGRGGRGGGPRGRGGHLHPPPHPHSHHHPHSADTFEFDDAMLRPGYGSPSPSPFHDSGTAGPAPPPHRPHPHFAHGHVPFWGAGGGGGHGQAQGIGHPPNWRPAPERPPVVVLQRPK